jgi:hypothetical protein
MSNRLVGLSGVLSFDLIAMSIFVARHCGTHRRLALLPALSPPTQDGTRLESRCRSFSSAWLWDCSSVFAAGLWSWFRQQEPVPQPPSSILGLAGIALVALILSGFVPMCLLAYRSEPASIAGLLADISFGLLAVSGIPTAVFLAAYTALVLRLGCIPRLTACIAGAGAGAHVLIAASFLSHGAFLSLESGVIVWVPATFFEWILATAAVLFRGHSTSTPRNASNNDARSCL